MRLLYLTKLFDLRKKLSFSISVILLDSENIMGLSDKFQPFLLAQKGTVIFFYSLVFVSC